VTRFYSTESLDPIFRDRTIQNRETDQCQTLDAVLTIVLFDFFCCVSVCAGT